MPVSWVHKFESCVNPEGYKAVRLFVHHVQGFESCVNPEGYKARQIWRTIRKGAEEVMSVSRPKFIDSPYFVPEPDNWHLKDGAPQDVVNEFNTYMEEYEKAMESGSIL